MSFFRANRRIVLRAFRTLFFAALVFYFSYHTVSGDKGIVAMVKLQQQVSVASAEMKEVMETRERLEHKVSMMYARSLDADLLEEQAKKFLGHAKPNEVVYFYN